MILVLNSGSSSMKYQLFDDSENVIATGLVEKIGEQIGCLKQVSFGEEKVIEEKIRDHRKALEMVVHLLCAGDKPVVKDRTEVKAIGHRVVHGAEEFSRPTVLTDDVIAVIRKCISLAPLHNPANLTGIEVAKDIFPEALQVGVFDTAFHQTMPEAAYRYALPNKLYEKYQVRRYGFHGTSHHYVSKECATFLNKDLSELNLISLHIGNGASICCIKNGKSVDTSMGLTPLEGLVMGTRCGDIDPALIQFIMEKEELTIDEVTSMMNKDSGLKGICSSNDMRDIWKNADKGDKKSKLALEIYAYRIKKYIGAYMAVLGDVDALIFTAGIGENDSRTRSLSLSGLKAFGIDLDDDLNSKNSGEIRKISKGSLDILIIPTNEELEIVRATKEFLAT